MVGAILCSQMGHSLGLHAVLAAHTIFLEFALGIAVTLLILPLAMPGIILAMLLRLIVEDRYHAVIVALVVIPSQVTTPPALDAPLAATATLAVRPIPPAWARALLAAMATLVAN